MRAATTTFESQSARVVAIMNPLLRHSVAATTASKAAVNPAARAGMEPLAGDWRHPRKASSTSTPAKAAASERSPLFAKADPKRVADIHGARLLADKLYGFPRPLVESECGFLSSLAAQMLLSNIIDFLPNFVAGVLTGHLSTAYSSEYIAARSLSGIFLMLTGFTVNIAIGAAMDTLCAQAYGAGKLHEMGIFFQTGLLLFTLCFVPVALLGYFCVDLLVLLGQRRDIAVLARSLVLYALPALPFHMVNALLGKILQGQNLIAPMVYAGLVGNVVHAVLIYVLMFHTSVGFVGSSIASSALVVCYTGTLCTYFYRSHLYQREWPGWRLADALALVPEFLRLGLAGLGMAMFEYWAFSTVALVAGMLPWADIAISADSTYSSFRYLCGLLYGTIAVAGSVRVGNALGANDPQRAKLAAFLSVAVSVALALATSLAMLMLKDVYPYAYTSDADVVSLTSQLMLLTCGFQVFAGVSVAGQGILRGSGMQALGARINFVSYLMVGLPTGLVLAYQCGLGLLGLWLGLCTGFVCSGSYCVFWLLHANWIEMAEDAQKRTREPSDRSPEQASWLC